MLTVANAHLKAMIAKSKTDDGAGIVEYVLLIVAIALVVLTAMAFLSGALGNQFNNIGNTVGNAPSN
jgi:Flp pilus assembly pilin Flp